MSAQSLSTSRMWALSKPSLWLTSNEHRILHRAFPIIDEEAIFLVHESAAVLSAEIRTLGWGVSGSFPSNSIASRTAL